MSEKSRKHYITLLIWGMILISTSAIIIKYSNAPSSIIGMYRLLFAAIALLPMVYLHKKELINLKRNEWIRSSMASFFLFVHFLFWFESLKLTTVASSTIILALQPLVAMIFGFLFFREKVSFMTVISMIIAIFGVGLIGFGDIGMSKDAIIGDLYSFISVIAVVIYLYIGQGVVKKVTHWIYSFVVFSVTAFFFLLFNLVTKTELTGFSMKEWLLFFLAGTIPTIAHVIHNYLLQHVSTTTISMSILGEPVGASILAYFLLQEHFETYKIVGGFLVIVSVWIFLKNQTTGASTDEESNGVITKSSG